MKTFHQSLAEIENNKKRTWVDIYYTAKRWFRAFYKSPRYIKWWYQRARYGYADCDWWNGDCYLAGVVAGIMEKIVKDGHAVSSFYAYGDWNADVDEMVRIRDEEYNRYIAIFREYSKNGPAINQEWKDDFGGVLDSDMQDALQWLSKHFQELWD